MKWPLSEYVGYKSESSVTDVVKIEMQIKGAFSSTLWRDPLKSNLRANFEAFKYKNDNRWGHLTAVQRFGTSAAHL